MLLDNKKPNINIEFISKFNDSANFLFFLNKEHNESNKEIISAINILSFLLKTIKSWKNSTIQSKKNIDKIVLNYNIIFEALNYFDTDDEEERFNSILNTNEGYDLLKVWMFPSNHSFLKVDKIEVVENIEDCKFILLFINDDVSYVELLEIGIILQNNSAQKVKVISDDIPEFIGFLLPAHNLFYNIEAFYKQIGQ